MHVLATNRGFLDTGAVSSSQPGAVSSQPGAVSATGRGFSHQARFQPPGAVSATTHFVPTTHVSPTTRDLPRTTRHLPGTTRHLPGTGRHLPGNTIRLVRSDERILALDLGRKRIGLAISDELGITAQGLQTLERQGRREDIETLRRLAVARGVTRFLLGDPLHMSGDASRQGEYTREFASELERKTGLPIEFRDERWTSREAERTIRGEGVANGRRKATIDQLSAVILLQSYLDSAPRGGLS